MHAILPGALWRATPPADRSQRPRVRVRVAKQVRAGATATVRWTATGASSVARWTIELDGRRVATRGSRRERVLRMRLTSPGHHRLRVAGLDAAGARVVASAQTVRVLRKRLRTPGRHRWRVLARDAAGDPIATASRGFRVLNAR